MPLPQPRKGMGVENMHCFSVRHLMRNECRDNKGFSDVESEVTRRKRREKEVIPTCCYFHHVIREIVLLQPSSPFAYLATTGVRPWWVFWS